MRHGKSDSDEHEPGDEITVNAQLRSSIDRDSVSSHEEDDALPSPIASSEAQSDSRRPVAWSELPRKDQLFIITMARMSEPLVQTSLQVRLTQARWWRDIKRLPDGAMNEIPPHGDMI